MSTSRTKRTKMKPYQVALEERIQRDTMALWEKGQLPVRKPWTGDSRRHEVYIPSGLIEVPKPGDMFEDV